MKKKGESGAECAGNIKFEKGRTDLEERERERERKRGRERERERERERNNGCFCKYRA